MNPIIPQTYAFGPQVALSNLSTAASTLIEFSHPLTDRAGVWFVAPASNTAEVSVSLLECADNTTFDRNAVVDLTPGEKRMFYVKNGQELHAYSKTAGQEIVAYEVVIERTKN